MSNSKINLLTAFNQQCLVTPTQTAFIEESRQLDYAEFQQKVNNLAYFLQQHYTAERPIALFLERGIDAAIAIYAVLNIGAAYLPLDTKNPVSRINLILNDAKPQLLIGLGAPPENLTTEFSWLDLTQIPFASSKFVNIAVDESSIAAILYTSGSTGMPKGVALSHGAMNNFALWAAKTFQLNKSDRIASLAPFHFDLSVFDLFSSLAIGASVVFVPSRLTLSPSRLTAWLSEMEISTFYTVPSLLSFIALKGNLTHTSLPKLKQILFAGEVFPTNSLIKLAGLLPKIELYNLYGPTETNVCCYWQVDRKRLQDNEPIPIGVAACGAELSISNNAELLVNCKNNFSGYWQQGQLIARDHHQPYATGDKVSRNQQGEYCYHGRLDRMLKCSGYRVEPAEIEAIINRIPGVINNAIVGISDSSSGQRPAAALVLKKQQNLPEIIQVIRQQLPAYMMPVKFEVLEVLPVLSNGKTDYLALTQLFEHHEL